MSPLPDPFQSHLNRAASLFEAGDVVQAGQIWQAILKRDPAHQAALAGLYQVKVFFEQKNGAGDSDRLLHEGCTLFDMGQVRDALQKWERILATEPRHKLALAYANDARRDLGLPPLPAPRDPAPAAEEAPRAGADQLVLEGVQLFDMGMPEEAVAKWQRALELNPQHPDAPGYLRMARREHEQEARPPAASPALPPAPAVAVNETQIWRAEQLLRDWRLEEAVQAFQRLLDQGPQDPRVVQGHHQAKALLAAQDEPHGGNEAVAEPSPRPVSIPQPVGPPQALTARSPAPRDGFRLPGGMKGLGLPRWLNQPRNLMLTFSLAVLGLLGLVLFGVHRREAALKEAVVTAKLNALKPVSRLVQIPTLPETLEAIRREAEGAVGDDPLLAYFRAQEWQRRDPDDPAAAQLVQRSRDKLIVLAPSAALADVDKALQAGDLEGARKDILELLRHDPDDLDLRGRARKVLLGLAPLYAGDDRMGKARDALFLGRAMFPQDLTWQARLKLLEALQAMAKPDRTPWIQLLG
jgi:tetratricopeptide (TPR) repeat protein